MIATMPASTKTAFFLVASGNGSAGSSAMLPNTRRSVESKIVEPTTDAAAQSANAAW